MSGSKFEDIHLGDLSLEPLPDPHLLNYQPKPEKPVRKVENRSKLSGDRRVADRRKTPRFEPNRRSGKERRPKEVWDPAIKNTT
jgi:hypothetical protein